MGENNNFGLVNVELPDCVDKVITNAAEKPAKAIGDSISDIWYLVFGGIGQAAEKKRMRYAIELEKYNKELHKKVDDIPEEERTEPDVQVIAPALEASKFCVEKKELREMFINLIASSLDKRKEKQVHPIFSDIIQKLSATDALLFKAIANNEFTFDCIIFRIPIEKIAFSLAVLEQLGLTTSQGIISIKKDSKKLKKGSKYNDSIRYESILSNVINTSTLYDIIYKSFLKILSEYDSDEYITDYFPEHISIADFFKKNISLTHLGRQFKEVCL